MLVIFDMDNWIDCIRYISNKTNVILFGAVSTLFGRHHLATLRPEIDHRKTEMDCQTQVCDNTTKTENYRRNLKTTKTTRQRTVAIEN